LKGNFHPFPRKSLLIRIPPFKIKKKVSALTRIKLKIISSLTEKTKNFYFKKIKIKKFCFSQ